MDVLSEQAIIGHLQAGRPLAATIEGGAFRIVVARYVPAVVTAIHDGHDIPDELRRRMLVDDAERRFEEDPYTGELASSFAISLTMRHSRYYYDINRRPDSCIYDDAWGKKVWREPLSESLRTAIEDLHGSYYRVLDTLLTVLEQRFSSCLIYDLHSYNYSRIPGDPPLFNIGTHYLGQPDASPMLVRLAAALAALKLPGVVNRTVFNEVFFGKGYQAEFVAKRHPRSQCLPIEIKKVFMDEMRLTLDQERFARLRHGLCRVLADHACFYAAQQDIDRLTSEDFLHPADNG